MRNREVEAKEKVMSRLKAQKENKVKNENEAQVVGHLFSFWINKDSGQSSMQQKAGPPAHRRVVLGQAALWSSR